jgi:antitoxin component of MazEF toxin-antitoxin module
MVDFLRRCNISVKKLDSHPPKDLMDLVSELLPQLEPTPSAWANLEVSVFTPTPNLMSLRISGYSNGCNSIHDYADFLRKCDKTNLILGIRTDTQKYVQWTWVKEKDDDDDDVPPPLEAAPPNYINDFINRCTEQGKAKGIEIPETLLEAVALMEGEETNLPKVDMSLVFDGDRCHARFSGFDFLQPGSMGAQAKLQSMSGTSTPLIDCSVRTGSLGKEQIHVIWQRAPRKKDDPYETPNKFVHRPVNPAQEILNTLYRVAGFDGRRQMVAQLLGLTNVESVPRYLLECATANPKDREHVARTLQVVLDMMKSVEEK